MLANSLTISAWRLAAFAAVLPCLVATPGCAVYGGTRGGVAVHQGEVEPVRAVQATTSLFVPLPGKQHAVRVGPSLEGRAELDGSMWTFGGEVGYAYVPYGVVGFEAHGDTGFALDPVVADGYAGATVGLPIQFAGGHPHSDRNRAFYLISRRVALVPEARYRVFWRTEEGSGLRHEATLGALVRIQMGSDLL